MTFSIRQFADDACKAIESEADDATFTFLRDARGQLLGLRHQAGVEGIERFVAYVLADFCEHIQDDLTRAVPWDDEQAIKNARISARGLIGEAFQKFAQSSGDAHSMQEFFASFGDIRTRYELLIDELNEQDRKHLAALRRN